MRPLAELSFVAGHLALDFVNSAEERGHPEAGDVLRTATDLRVWGQRYGLLSESVAAERSELRRALDARELLYRLFFARTRGCPFSRADLEQLAELAAAAYRAGALSVGSERTVAWRWPPSELSTVRHVAVTSGLDLLASDHVARVKQCPGDGCGWFFLDTTKRGNRRWCSMSECGQEAKTARRRSRRQPTAARRPAA